MSAATPVLPCDPAELPDNPALLKSMLAEALAALVASQRHGAQLQAQVEQLLRRLFGRKSERLDPDQLLLFDLSPPETPATPPAPDGDADDGGAPRRRKGHGRRRQPSHLPREPRVYELSEAERACDHCGQLRQVIGQEKSEQLEYTPASLKVIEHIRLTYACSHCEKQRRAATAPAPAKATPTDGPVPLSAFPLSDAAATALVPPAAGGGPLRPTFVTAPLPAWGLARCLAGPGLLAHVIVSKYCDHLPLYRCERQLARFGADVRRSTLCDWLKSSADALRPLWELMCADVLLSRLLQTDETGVRVLGRAATDGPPGRLWVQCGDAAHPYVVYRYSVNKEGQWPQAFLADFRGYLQGDAYAGYDALFATGAIVEVGCWAHARRKFWEARDTDPEAALYALGIIRLLYGVERKARQQAQAGKLSQAEFEALRLRLRQEESVPLLKAFGEWLERQAAAVLPKSPLAAAVGYARNQWAALQVYATMGFLEIDNNAAERALRPVAVGRKNYLFFGSDVGGDTAAVLYSFVQSCRRLGVEPWRYLSDVLSRISTQPREQLAELLPDRWAAAQRAAVLAATGPPADESPPAATGPPGDESPPAPS
jgi:transposase